MARAITIEIKDRQVAERVHGLAQYTRGRRFDERAVRLPSGLIRAIRDVLGSRMATRYDAIVIGTGQAGPRGATAAGAGLSVAIVERKRFGGTCVNTGCIPTKTHGGERLCRAHGARARREFGVDVDGRVRVDMQRVKARKDADRRGVARRARAVAAAARRTARVYEGHARFESPHDVRVGDDVLERRADLHQRRRPRARARTCRASTRSPTSPTAR